MKRRRISKVVGWFAQFARRRDFDPDLELPGYVAERVIKLLNDQERAYESRLRTRNWIIVILSRLSDASP